MAGTVYASVGDILSLGIPLTDSQQEAAEIFLAAASSKLRVLGRKYGRDIDELAEDEDYGAVVKNTVIQAVIRALSSVADNSPGISQATQSALGYSVSMTYISAGQSLYFLRNELKELGLMRQTYGGLEVYGGADDTRNGG